MEYTSCVVCRKRKIKCDRTPRGCQKCRKFGVQCVYSMDAGADVGQDRIIPGDAITQAGLKRRRILRSCVECKRAKAKCSGGYVCTRCNKKCLSCFYHDIDSDSQEKQAPRQPSCSIPTWLTASDLPSIDRIRSLTDIYFSRIHTVRCMGFLHIPSFMERFDNPDLLYTKDSGLIYIMCALAAPFYYAKTIDVMEDGLNSSVRFLNAGKGWADSAMRHVFSNFGNPEIECLMTEVLLQEYYLRIGDYAKGFLISGVISRHIQMLQLNLEYDFDILCQQSKLSVVAKESRRRLIWSCYLLDAFIECGIDQLRFVSSEDIQVQLPCLEDLFIRRIPCITEMLSRSKLLPFVDQPLGILTTDNLDMRAFYIRAMAIRAKILKYVKQLEGEVPWEVSDNSQFYKLDKELKDLEDSIPDTFKMSSENTYIFKASGRLNLYFGLHILISQTFNDLYRVGVSNLVFPDSATKWIRDNAPEEFITRCHRMCANKAIRIASLLKDLWNCDKPSLVDVPYVVHIQVCSSVLVTTLASWTGPEPLTPGTSHQDYREMLQNNAAILKYLQRYIRADLYYESVNNALKRFNESFSPETSDGRNISELNPRKHDKSSNPPQFSLEYILNPLGVYPIARKQAHDRHEPEVSGTQGFSTIGLTNIGNPALTSTSILNLDSMMSPVDMASNQIWDWESEMPIMDSMGYPTFLGPLFENND